MPGDAKPFRMARDVYKSCMDVAKIEQLGLDPIKRILQDLGGWPVLIGKYRWCQHFEYKYLRIDINSHRCCTALTFGPPATLG